MNFKPVNPALTAIMVAALGLALTGCGRVGALDQPAPMWGAKAKADYKAKKDAEAAAKGDKGDGDPEPLAPDTPGADAPKGRIDTLRAAPVPGARSLPGSGPTPGVLPDPYSRPQ